MRVALTIHNNRIAPVFDVARRVLLVGVENGEAVQREEQALPANSLFEKMHYLTEAGVQTLICGALCHSTEADLTRAGMQVLPFVSGDVESVLQGWLTGQLPGPDFAMPGCGRRRKRQGRACGRGRGPARNRRH